MATLVLHPETSNSQRVHLEKPSLLIGSASDADVCLESELVSDHHARVEQKPDGYYLISLTNPPRVFVNDVEVTFQRLEPGDVVTFGDVKAEFLLTDGEEAVVEEMPRDATFPAGTTALVESPQNFRNCPQCGMVLTLGAQACPQCGFSMANLPAIPMNFVPPTPAGQTGPGMLPVIALLAALTVVGAPVALALGLMTLSIIRQRGGTLRDRSLGRWSIGLSLVWLMLGGVVAGSLVWQEREREQLNVVEVYEAKVIRALKNLACAQKYAHTIEYYDADADGHGEYGALSVLAEIKSPFFDANLSDGDAYGYWFTVRETSEGQFLAVAEPVRYGETGIRTFTINQAGLIRGGDADGKRFGQIASVLPALQGERSAYYEIDDEIAKDVLNYVKSISSSPDDQEKKKRILMRLRKDYSLTSVGRELEGMEATVDRFVSEQRAQAIYQEAQDALAKGNQDVALAKLTELQEEHSSFSEIAAADRKLLDLRSMIAQRREQEALALFTQADELERQGQQEEVQSLYQRIEKLYPDSDVAERIASLKPKLQRQLREHDAEDIFSDLMELSPESEYEKILNLIDQLRRNYDDTDLLAKMKIELANKERQARSNAWRFKTEQNMALGRMRGALAQLEAAARENPDLLYDLRDLCAQLYRSVADKLVEESNFREALVYYERLNRLLQASHSEQVNQDLLARLHKDVGLADYEQRKYKEARWHLASAAWKYREDAQFNIRLGSASLYSGLYRPAETALTQTLSLQPDMEQALLYRAYLNLRIVLELEQAIAEGFELKVALKGKEESDDDDDDDDDDEDEDDDDDDDEDEDDFFGEENIDFFQFTGSAGASIVPKPTDVDLSLRFDYGTSKTILPYLMRLTQDMQMNDVERKIEEKRLLQEALKERQKAARGTSRAKVAVSQKRKELDFYTQLSDLRMLHLEDTAARKELCDVMKEMTLRICTATSDIKAAGDKQPQIQSVTESILSQIKEKHELLLKAEDLISISMNKEAKVREQALGLAKEMLLEPSSSFEREMARLTEELRKTDSAGEINQALLILKNSMDVQVGVENILRAAEGNLPSGGGASFSGEAPVISF